MKNGRQTRRKSRTRMTKPEAAYALHIDAKRVARLRRIAKKQFVEPSMAELVRAILDLGMDQVEKIDTDIGDSP